MGVVTTADQKRDRAKECVYEAYRNLLDVLNPETWGHSDFNKNYIATLEECAIELSRIKRKL